MAGGAIPLTQTSLPAEEPVNSLALLALFRTALLLNHWLKLSQLVLLGRGLGLVVTLLCCVR